MEWMLTLIFKDKEFSKFRNALDSEMKRLQVVELGTGQRKAKVMNFEDEELVGKGKLG